VLSAHTIVVTVYNVSLCTSPSIINPCTAREVATEPTESIDRLLLKGGIKMHCKKDQILTSEITVQVFQGNDDLVLTDEYKVRQE